MKNARAKITNKINIKNVFKVIIIHLVSKLAPWVERYDLDIF